MGLRKANPEIDKFLARIGTGKNHPDVDAFLISLFQQVRNVHGHDAHYMGKPQHVAEDPDNDMDQGSICLLQGDAQQEFCRYRDRNGEAHALTATVRVFPPSEGSFPAPGGVAVGGASDTRFPTGQVGNITDATNPFNTQTVNGGLVLPANLQQTLEIIGSIEEGHQGMTVRIPFNMPLGQILRLPATGSAVTISGKFTPRYTPKLGAGAVFSWLVAPAGSNFDRCVAFDSVPAASAFVLGVSTPVLLQGFVGKGFSAPIPVKRIFFGWVDPQAAQNTQHLCPVPRGAQTVVLVSDASQTAGFNNDPGVGAAFANVRLLFNQICQSPGAGTTRRTMYYPPNTTVLLRSDCVAIEVVNQDVPPVGQGIPFELQYDLGL